jgi:predicted aspartyl protease
VIEVTFNGNQRFPMILDTGASHTHISRAMANHLGIIPIGQARATTASHENIVFDVGRVESIEVAGIRQVNVPVSIGDSVEIGLLGNDFYQDYDLILQANAVTFRRRP